jgi:hypothetical protein
MTLEAAIKDPTVIPKQQQQQQQQPHAHLSQHTSGTLDDIEPMHQLFLKEYQVGLRAVLVCMSSELVGRAIPDL